MSLLAACLMSSGFLHASPIIIEGIMMLTLTLGPLHVVHLGYFTRSLVATRDPGVSLAVPMLYIAVV
jgi:hypothetical protein